MSEITPEMLARELRRTGLQIRSFLRAAFPDDAPGRGGRWSLSAAQIQAVRDHFGPHANCRRAQPRANNQARVPAPSDLIHSALASLSGPGQPIADAVVPAKPGLYAIYGPAKVWRQLGLGAPPDARPLYVGKAEDSLVARDLRYHFADGRTGSSTLRRSFAALLHDELGLRGQPRNPMKPGHFANYGLSAEHDQRLSKWMSENLAIATWTPTRSVVLGVIEMDIVRT